MISTWVITLSFCFLVFSSAETEHSKIIITIKTQNIEKEKNIKLGCRSGVGFG